MKQEIIVGKRIGLFDVLYECDFKSNDGHRMFHVKCSDCGWETDMQMHQIKYTKKCNHLETTGRYINPFIRWKDKRLCGIFQGMKVRCYNPNDRSYRWYGAKGIKICDEWLNNPLLFEEWSLKNGYNKNLTIDRIDETKGYSPDNCRWVTASDNSKYKSTTKETMVNGVIHTGREWANALNMGANTINQMLREYPEEQVISFIDARLKDKTKTRKSHQTWMQVYNID